MQLFNALTPLFALIVSNLWWVLGSLSSFILVWFAASTAPRNAYGYALFAVLAYTFAMVGLCIFAVFTSSGFSAWSPWIRLALCCGIAITWFTIGLGLLKVLSVRWPLSDDSRQTIETWLVPLGGLSAFAAVLAVWLFAVEILDYESWLAKSVAGLSVAAGVAIGALLVLGAIVTIIGSDETS